MDANGWKLRAIYNTHSNTDYIVEFCTEPLCFDKLLQKLFEEYRLDMNFQQYALVGSTVRSYLAWLKDTGRINARFEDNMLLWGSVKQK